MGGGNGIILGSILLFSPLPSLPNFCLPLPPAPLSADAGTEPFPSPGSLPGDFCAADTKQEQHREEAARSGQGSLRGYIRQAGVSIASSSGHLPMERGTGGGWAEFKPDGLFYCGENSILELFMSN